jgi:lipid-A-disaccharide synthase
MIHLADFVLAASGTATLMVGLLEKPMVIMYRLKWLTGVIARILVRGVTHFGIVNLILGKEIVPERWQEGASADELFKLMKRYLDDADHTESVRANLRLIRHQLGEKGATARVAEALKTYWGKSAQ